MAAMPILPSEVWDVVLDHLHDSRQSLFSCSLVCKSWLVTSRLHTFGSITLTTSNTDEFYPTLASDSCTLCASIRSVRFRYGSIAWSDEMPLTAQREMKVLRKLINVRSLALDESAAGYGQVSNSVFGSVQLATVFPNTTSLRLQAIIYPSFRSLCEVIAAFSRIEELHLDNLSWIHEPPPSDFEVGSCPPVPVGLRSLKVARCYHRDIFEWLLVEPNFRLSTLQLGNISPSDIEAISRLLRRSGPSLKVLRFGFGGMNPGGDAGKPPVSLTLVSPLALSSFPPEEFYLGTKLHLNTDLESLLIRGYIVHPDYTSCLTTPEHWVSRILATLHSTNIKQISLEVTCHPLHAIQEHKSALVELDGVLAKCSHLQEVWFYSRVGRTPRVDSLMPKLAERGFDMCGPEGRSVRLYRRRLS